MNWAVDCRREAGCRIEAVIGMVEEVGECLTRIAVLGRG